MFGRFRCWMTIHARALWNVVFWVGLAACILGPVLALWLNVRGLLLSVAGCFAVNWSIRKDV